MTISITVATPNNKRAKITRSDGVEQFVEPGSTGNFCIHDGAPILTIEEIDASAAAAPLSGGTGNGPPK
ncbi:hypothetical protein WBP07_17855 [Novosphingobium sp. BL-8A]|uniref:hypothetical protein n=1 Tax=Novosphingobium sp. BL-8A TaxID=3127639 RepID=UPI0037584036